MNIVGIDIGGTFTDLVGHVDGRIVTSKTSTVPADPTRGIAEALRLAGCDPQILHEILHGSTVAINTVLERKGAPTALITTRGFRDVYAIGRSNRIEAYNLFCKRPQPLVPRDLTFEVERADEELPLGGEVFAGVAPDQKSVSFSTFVNIQKKAAKKISDSSSGLVLSSGRMLPQVKDLKDRLDPTLAHLFHN
jgi:N-methylhydantoinase A